MTRPLALLAIAELDIEDAVRWYEDQCPGLGDNFLLDLEELLEHICHNPDMYQAAVGKVRRAVFHSFPYSVLYRVLPERIEVVGILPSRGDPRHMALRSSVRRKTQ